MTTKRTVFLAFSGLMAAGAFSGTALATGTALVKGNDENPEATALQSAKVSLSQAIASAEQQTGGRAYDAGVDVKGKQIRIVVETNGPKGIQTVAIDAQSGQIVASHPGGESD